MRATARKDQWGEVHEWICNECRFEKKKTSDWAIEGPTKVNRHSVISQGHYLNTVKPQEVITDVMNGRPPKMLMDIHSVSGVNTVDLSSIPGPASGVTFNGDPHAFADNPTDKKAKDIIDKNKTE